MMKHLNKDKNKRSIVTAAVMAFLILAAPLVLLIPISQSAEAAQLAKIVSNIAEPKAPMAASR